MGVVGRGARGLPSSSTVGWVGGRAVVSVGSIMFEGSDCCEEDVVGERRWRDIGGGIASSALLPGDEGMGEVGDSGGWSECRWQ